LSIHIQDASCDQRRPVGKGLHSGHWEAELHDAVGRGEAVNTELVNRASEGRIRGRTESARRVAESKTDVDLCTEIRRHDRWDPAVIAHRGAPITEVDREHSLQIRPLFGRTVNREACTNRCPRRANSRLDNELKSERSRSLIRGQRIRRYRPRQLATGRSDTDVSHHRPRGHRRCSLPHDKSRCSSQVCNRDDAIAVGVRAAATEERALGHSAGVRPVPVVEFANQVGEIRAGDKAIAVRITRKRIYGTGSMPTERKHNEPQ
jgi:hypothetical protein